MGPWLPFSHPLARPGRQTTRACVPGRLFKRAPCKRPLWLLAVGASRRPPARLLFPVGRCLTPGASIAGGGAPSGGQFNGPRGRAAELVEGHTGIVGQWRRPLLQLVVLFASDNRIYNFALKTMQRFIDAGIDVFLQVGGLHAC